MHGIHTVMQNSLLRVSYQFPYTHAPSTHLDVQSNDDLFDRLETVRLFRLFTGEGDMENTAGVIQNPEA